MARRKQSPRFEVTAPAPGSGLIHIVERDTRDVVAIVTAGRSSDAHQLAASPEMYARLTEVTLLRKPDGGRSIPLLPAEAIRSIKEVLSQARGEA
jgi:hypothetical protein